jgi:osmoprotectant transport system ATP-binding protein
MITFSNVTKTYPDRTVAVDDLSLDIPEGTLAAFVGPSGCGKTTSMRMINRMIDPTSGTLTVNGADVSKVDPVKLRLGIGYVIQSAGLMPHQRCVSTTSPPCRCSRVSPAARPARPRSTCWRASDWIPHWDNAIRPSSRAVSSSASGVARALAADPPILLMDEPFSAVDPVVREELQAEILRLQSELRKTIVFVTHDIDEAVKLADVVAVFGRGGVLQQFDPPQRLLSNPANDFVAGFVGADRGYRGLGFLPNSGLPLHDIRHLREDGIDALELGPGEWALVTKADGDTVCVDRRSRGGPAPKPAARCTTAPPRLAHCCARTARCGTPWTPALSSPAGLGVAVDEHEQVIGGVLATDVLAAIEDRRRQR